MKAKLEILQTLLLHHISNAEFISFPEHTARQIVRLSPLLQAVPMLRHGAGHEGRRPQQFPTQRQRLHSHCCLCHPCLRRSWAQAIVNIVEVVCGDILVARFVDLEWVWVFQRNWQRWHVLILQKLGAYLKFNADTVTYNDCRPMLQHPMSWYASLAAGFATTKQISGCNAVFVDIGHHVFVHVTKFICAGSEILVFFPFLDKYML